MFEVYTCVLTCVQYLPYLVIKAFIKGIPYKDHMMTTGYDSMFNLDFGILFQTVGSIHYQFEQEIVESAPELQTGLKW